MYVVNKTKEGISSLPSKEIDKRHLRALGSSLAQRILCELSKKPNYASNLAKGLKENEQKIFYHLRNLEKAKVIEIIRKETIRGAIANIYSLKSPSFVIKFKDFETAQKIAELEHQPGFLEPFIEDGKLNSLFVVGSPDPHGPEKARSRDGYYGIDLALFLGTFLNYIPDLSVKLDTEVKEEDLQTNLILLGGPVVNSISAKINNKLPIKFDKENNWDITSTISGKTYHSDETGVVVKIKNPFNSKKFILLVAGKRHSGTRALMIAFLKHFKELAKGNKFNNKIFAKVIEGIDMDYDGIVDTIEVLE